MTSIILCIHFQNLYYHDSLKTLHKIEISEDFKSPKSPPGYVAPVTAWSCVLYSNIKTCDNEVFANRAENLVYLSDTYSCMFVGLIVLTMTFVLIIGLTLTLG